MKTKTITTTISPELLNWVTDHAKTTKQTRRTILEKALVSYKIEAIQNSMKADFLRAQSDTATLELAEWGMDDYQKLVN